MLLLSLLIAVHFSHQLCSANVINNVDLPSNRQVFDKWKQQFGKTYSSQAEEDAHLATFLSNLETIASSNSQLAHINKTSFTMGLNQFSDLTYAEFSQQYLSPMTLPADYSARGEQYIMMQNASTRAASIDWTTARCLSLIQNQFSCGSCYAFAATAVVEHYYCMRKSAGMFYGFSEQQIVDCSKIKYNSGCGGGYTDESFEYLQKAGGFMLSNSYPYTATDGPCRYNAGNAKPLSFSAKATTFVTGGKFNYNAVMNALQNVGPLTFYYYVTDSFQRYRSGVYSSTVGCPSDPNNVNHVMVLVGFGTDAYYGDYWLVKNSWGSNWGEKGYIRIARNANLNICNMLYWVEYPNII